MVLSNYSNINQSITDNNNDTKLFLWMLVALVFLMDRDFCSVFCTRNETQHNYLKSIGYLSRMYLPLAQSHLGLASASP